MITSVSRRRLLQQIKEHIRPDYKCTSKHVFRRQWLLFYSYCCFDEFVLYSAFQNTFFYDTETTTNENSFQVIHHFGWLMCRHNWLYVLYFTRQDIRMPIHRQCLTFFGVRCNCITVPIQYVKRPRQLGLCEICRSCTM